jgi:hypothetical protein
MSESLSKPEIALARVAAFELVSSTSLHERDDECDDNENLEDDLCRHVSPQSESLGDVVIRLREWATNRTFPLHILQVSGAPEPATTAALQLSRDTAVASTNRVELAYESRLWRIRDWDGIANLRQDGRPTREVSLLAGTEVAIGGRTLIAESPRSIALRNFCLRLIGWGDDRIGVVDHALRAIRLACSGRAPLILRGAGDLVLVAYTIHRYTLGSGVPFIVSDPRRKDTGATVRGPANLRCGMEAFRRALGGTVCVRSIRLPEDFEHVLNAFREPDCGVQLVVCAKESPTPGRDPFAVSASPIDIPRLATRYPDLFRIVREYVDDVTSLLHVPDDCLGSQDIEWIMSSSVRAKALSIPDIEKAVWRMVAVRTTRDLSKAAALLGMARVSLERWLRRRYSSPSWNPLSPPENSRA